MTRIRFEDLPSTNTPRNAENLNKLNNVVISPTEPTTGEEVWINNTNKKIYTKNDNGGYEEFYSEEEHNKQVYSTSEQRIGTWIDGKPIYRKVLDCGLLLNSGVKEVPTGLTNVNYLKWDAIAVYIQGGSTDWPYQITNETKISDKKAKITCNGNLSAYNGYVTILYTKN